MIRDSADAVLPQVVAEQRIDEMGESIEDLGPIEFGEAIGLPLRRGWVVELNERIVL